MQYVLCNLDGTVAMNGDRPHTPKRMTEKKAGQENYSLHAMGQPFAFIETSRIEDGRVVWDPYGRRACDICSRRTPYKVCSECGKVLIMRSVPDEGDEE